LLSTIGGMQIAIPPPRKRRGSPCYVFMKRYFTEKLPIRRKNKPYPPPSRFAPQVKFARRLTPSPRKVYNCTVKMA
jgi:hypothetical protein